MSNNSSLPANSHPQTARDLINQFVQNNLHIIQTRSICLARRIQAISDASTTLKENLAALGDVMSAPFLRLGRKFRASPITSQISAAAREFNNELASVKLRVSTHIRNLSGGESLSAPLRRSIERLGLRMNVIKLDLEDLIASGEADHEADQPETASNSKAPTAAHQPPATQNQPRPTPAQSPSRAPEPAKTEGPAPASRGTAPDRTAPPTHSPAPAAPRTDAANVMDPTNANPQGPATSPPQTPPSTTRAA